MKKGPACGTLDLKDGDGDLLKQPQYARERCLRGRAGLARRTRDEAGYTLFGDRFHRSILQSGV